MKVWGDFLWPPRSTDKTTLIIKVSKGAKIRKRYNQVPHLTQVYVIWVLFCLKTFNAVCLFPLKSFLITYCMLYCVFFMFKSFLLLTCVCMVFFHSVI